jgi:hypothetical protein
MQRVVLRGSSSARLPTISRLFGGIGLAFTGFFAGSTVMPYLPIVLKGAGVLPLVAASFGLLVGWRVIGPQVGQGYRNAMMVGLRGALYVAIWALIYLGAAQMLRLSLRLQYDSVTEAVLDVVAKGIEFGIASFQPPVIGTLLVGGVLSGIFAEWGRARWR